MHRDKKTGLALAVLLCGIVGALFFRNEPHPEENIPSLDNPEAIDSEIADKPIAPYLQDGQRAAASQAAPKTTAASRPESPQWKTPDWLKGEHPQSIGTSSDLPAGPPDPIQPPGRAGENPLAAAAAHQNTKWQPKKASTDAVEAPTYEVQSGDTLSGIAARFLGSGALYMEVYDANRDVLNSPNDLRSGMTIRIPRRDGQRPPIEFSKPPSSSRQPENVEKPPAANSRRVEVQPISTQSLVDEKQNSAKQEAKGSASGEAPQEALPPAVSKPPSRKFVPVRRNPLAPGPVAPPAAQK